MTRQDAFHLLDRAMHEFHAARFSVVESLHRAQMDPTILKGGDIKFSHLRDCSIHLENTFLLRLFTEFERILRSYWARVRPSPRIRRTRMEILMQRVSALLDIHAPVFDGADEVRENRNQLAHAENRLHALTLAECNSRLARYISYFPRQ